MKQTLKSNGLSVPKITLTAILCAICLLTIVYTKFTTDALFSYFYCLAIFAFSALPLALTLMFRWDMNFAFYAFFSAYAFGPLLGAVYNFYYYTSWWDDLLHAMAGTVFAVVGAYIAIAINKNNKTSYILSALFGVLFSISVAVVWEFYEFSADMLLNSDMQADTVINTISTKINLTDGGVQIFDNISDTTVNGQSLGINGYLDIGLIDTITDMFLETVGALVFLVYVLVDKDRHPMITKLPPRKTLAK